MSNHIRTNKMLAQYEIHLGQLSWPEFLSFIILAITQLRASDANGSEHNRRYSNCYIKSTSTVDHLTLLSLFGEPLEARH